MTPFPGDPQLQRQRHVRTVLTIAKKSIFDTQGLDCNMNTIESQLYTIVRNYLEISLKEAENTRAQSEMSNHLKNIDSFIQKHFEGTVEDHLRKMQISSLTELCTALVLTTQYVFQERITFGRIFTTLAYASCMAKKLEKNTRPLEQKEIDFLSRQIMTCITAQDRSLSFLNGNLVCIYTIF